MPSKVILLGMNNPLSEKPEHALWPSPPNCTGWRIWRMLASVSSRKVTAYDYRRMFDRRNLLDSCVWDAQEAKVAARLLVEELRGSGRCVVVFGAEPRRALGLGRLTLRPQKEHGCVWYCAPHPSGRCHWYNSRKNRESLGRLLIELYKQEKS